MTTIICIDTPNIAMKLQRNPQQTTEDLKFSLIYITTQTTKEPIHITIPYTGEGTSWQKHKVIQTINQIITKIEQTLNERKFNQIKQQLAHHKTTRTAIQILRLTTPQIQQKLAHLTQHTKILNKNLENTYRELTNHLRNIHDDILKYIITPIKAHTNIITNTNIKIWLITYDKDAKKHIQEAQHPLQKLLKQQNIELYTLPPTQEEKQ